VHTVVAVPSGVVVEVELPLLVEAGPWVELGVMGGALRLSGRRAGPCGPAPLRARAGPGQRLITTVLTKGGAQLPGLALGQAELGRPTPAGSAARAPSPARPPARPASRSPGPGQVSAKFSKRRRVLRITLFPAAS
jgi:hypothetical protein